MLEIKKVSAILVLDSAWRDHVIKSILSTDAVDGEREGKGKSERLESIGKVPSYTIPKLKEALWGN